MDVHQDIAKWLKDMGYEGKVPADLPSLCNKYTNLIWKELMETVRPKQDVERVKRNIILNRLKTKPINQQETFHYKIKEIETYNQKLIIEQKLKLLNKTVDMNRRNVTQLLQKCKQKEVAVNFLKNKIQENEQRQYLLEAKKSQLEQQHLEAEQLLSKLKNVTPVEREESCTTEEITQTLEHCALKLKMLLIKDQKLKEEELCCLSKASSISMKNVPEQSFRTPQTGSDRVFSGARHEFSGIVPFASEQNSPFDSSHMTDYTRTPKRFESCFGSTVDLLSPIRVSLRPFNDSQDLVFKVPDTNLVKKRIKSNGYSVKKLYNDPEVNKVIEKVLHKNNAELLHEALKKSIHNADIEFKKIIMDQMRMPHNVGNNKMLDSDIAKLAFIHVQTEMKIIQQNKVKEELLSKINGRKMHILASLKAGSNHGQLQEDRLEIALKQIFHQTSLAAMIKEINSLHFEIEGNESTLLASKATKIKNEIDNKLQLIQLTIDEMVDLEKFLVTNCESINNANWHMRSLVINPSWMSPLLNDNWQEEMRVFERFPLQYQRRFISTRLSPDLYGADIQMGTHDMHLLAEILDSPLDPPETILLRILKAKMKFDVLKTIRNLKTENKHFEELNEKYSFAELTHQECYLNYAVDRLKHLIMSSKSCDTLAAAEIMKRSIEIWLECPMAEFISDTRIVEGHNYQYFKNRLNMFL